MNKTNIIERRKEEKSLRLAQFSLDHSQDAIFRMTRDARITYANDAACRHLGYSKDELLALSIPDINPDYSQELWDKRWEEVENTGWRRFEGRHKRKDGTIVPVEIVTNFIEYNCERYHFATVRDITERKQLANALEISERYLRAIFESIPDATLICDEQGVITMANQQTENMLGYKVDELVGQSIEVLVPERFRASHPALRTQFAASPASRPMGAGRLVRAKRKDGSELDVEISLSPIHTAQGLFFASSLRDVTERKRIEDELQRHRDHLEELVEERTHELLIAKEAAEAANKAKSQFLSSMSHELRTPLNAVLGFGQLLESDNALNEEEHIFVSEIVKAGHHLLVMITEILDLSRIESGNIQLSIEPVACGELADMCLRLIQPLAQARDIRVEHDHIAEVVVRADGMRLKQVLINLLSNAVKYNRDGGQIRLHTASADGGAVRIMVTDSGYGIPAERLPELFQPFSRLGAEGGTIEGSGIGLTISKRLVELMGGRIGVESEAGTGSTFWIELPRAELGR